MTTVPDSGVPDDTVPADVAQESGTPENGTPEDAPPDPRRCPDDSGGARPHAAHRNTRQRGAIAALLDQAEGFLSAQALYTMLRERGERIGLTTVYRTLQAMADGGELDVIRPADGEQMYRRCSRGHHHHLICRACGRTVEVEGPAEESWADRVAARYGYHDVSHTLEIFGICPQCEPGTPAGDGAPQASGDGTA